MGVSEITAERRVHLNAGIDKGKPGQGTIYKVIRLPALHRRFRMGERCIPEPRGK